MKKEIVSNKNFKEGNFRNANIILSTCVLSDCVITGMQITNCTLTRCRIIDCSITNCKACDCIIKKSVMFNSEYDGDIDTFTLRKCYDSIISSKNDFEINMMAGIIKFNGSSVVTLSKA